jgi:hypothetical protein
LFGTKLLPEPLFQLTKPLLWLVDDRLANADVLLVDTDADVVVVVVTVNAATSDSVTSWGQCYKTFYGRNLLLFVIS